MMDKKVLVIGLGTSGQSAAKFLLLKAQDVVGYDQNKILIETNPEIASLTSLGLVTHSLPSAIDIQEFKLVVVSPGIPHSDPLYAQAVQLGIEIIGEIELGARFVENRCIGITGTNGKTTVTLLIEHILNESGIKAVALGNVGNPLTSYLSNNPDKNEILVVELSSYQLETMSSQIFESGLLLNITPDHLDRYKGMEDYAKAKIHLKNCIKNENLFVNEKCYHEFKELFQSTDTKLFGTSSACEIRTDLENVYFKEQLEYKLPLDLKGVLSHEIENMIAVYAIVKEFNITATQFLNAFLLFKKPAHRIEFVREINSVKYYDDSKGTNIDAVMQAVTSLKGPLYLIAGGVDKGASYNPWKANFKSKVKRVLAIGQAAKKIKDELSPDIQVDIYETLEAAIKSAACEAKANETILLSPGCSSFDMFKDYKERGDEFKRIVNLI